MIKQLIHWISSSLNRKFITGATAGLLSFSVLFLILFIGMYRSQLQQEKANAANQVNRLLQTSLEAAMLRRDLDMLRSIVNQFGAQQGVNNIGIINRNGVIRFSNHPERLDRPIALKCDGCEFDPSRSTTAISFFTHNEQGENVLRSIHPVLNRTPCKECHGPTEINPVNGTLVVDYQAATIQQQARKTTLMLMGSGSVIVVVNLIGGWWFMRRFVLRPIAHLKETSHALAEGDFNARVKIDGDDELAQLGARFNYMAANLQASLREIKNKETFLQGLVDANPDGIRIIDDKYNVVLANKAYCEQMGIALEQAVGQPCYFSHQLDKPCVPTLICCPLHEIRTDSEPLKIRHNHITATGKEIAVEIFAAAMTTETDSKTEQSATLIVESIRDLDKTMQISHEHKLSEIGRLAAGVAHEIHNPLASVRLALDASIRFGNSEENIIPKPVNDCLLLVDREVNRCIEVTERLLKLSMFTGVENQIVLVNQAIDETISLLKWEAAEDGIEIQLKLDKSQPRVLANESDLRIIILNLVQNAFHAITGQGLLTVITKRETGHVYLLFEDTGIGIPIENLHRIFDPFFSHRADKVQGTGLGLAITQALVERYNGTITAENRRDPGSRFILSFPDPDIS